MSYTTNLPQIDLRTAPLAGIVESGCCYLNTPESSFTIGGYEAAKKGAFSTADGLTLVKLIGKVAEGDKGAWYALFEMARHFRLKEWWTRVFAVILYRRSKGLGHVDLRVPGYPFHPDVETILKNMEAVFASYLTTTNKGDGVKTSKKELMTALTVVATAIVDLLYPEQEGLKDVNDGMPKPEMPKAAAKPKTSEVIDTPKEVLAKTEAPKKEAPKKEAPKAEAPKTEAPKKETEVPKATIADVRALVQKHLVGNREAIIQIMAAEGVKGVGALTEDRYDAVCAALRALDEEIC